MSANRAAALLMACLLPLSLGGCHVLLVFPCLAGCDTSLYSLPPRNDPLARALAQGSDVNTVDARMTLVSRTQYAALNGQWPQPPDCAQVAAVGCRYAIPVEVVRRIVMALEPQGCGMMEVTIVAGARGLPEARRSAYREMPCPPEASRQRISSELTPE